MTEAPAFAYPLTAAATLAISALLFLLAVEVARMRTRHKVPPPRMDGPPEFMKRFRVHINTTEHVVIFLPVMWLAALTAGDDVGAIGGGVWLLGRIVYAFMYYSEPKTRLPGFALSVTAYIVLLAAVAQKVMPHVFERLAMI